VFLCSSVPPIPDEEPVRFYRDGFREKNTKTNLLANDWFSPGDTNNRFCDL
jgi:hypothetical protein